VRIGWRSKARLDCDTRRLDSRTKRTANHRPGAIVYLRASPKWQANSPGLDLQRTKCVEHAARLGLSVLSEHVDIGLPGTSALASRAGLQAAIAAVQAAPGSVLIVYALSRLGSSQRRVWELWANRGPSALPVSSATEPFDTSTPTGREVLGMLGVWTRLDADTEEAEADAPATSANDDTQPFMNPTNVARRVMELYAKGKESLTTLTDSLNAQGLRSVKRALSQLRPTRRACETAAGSDGASTQ